MDERDDAEKLLPAHLAEMVGRHVQGSVHSIAHVGHDCQSGPAGEMREFESADGLLSIQWCDACEWHGIHRQLDS